MRRRIGFEPMNLNLRFSFVEKLFKQNVFQLNKKI